MSLSKNAYMLQGRAAKDGYDWWWHSLTAINRKTGEAQPFFIEYYVINPGMGADEPVFGQLKENKSRGIKPSYAMIKAGTWGDKPTQINNFYSVNDFFASKECMDVRIGECTANEVSIKGSVKLTETEAKTHPEYMSDYGEMSWDLAADKQLSYDVGYGSSSIFNYFNAFKMFWHIQGMKTKYKGTIAYNGDLFDVFPDTSYGYQDKNWGSDYTNPWIWLNCNNFKSTSTNKKLDLTSLDVGGGTPVAFGFKIPKKKY